MEEDTTIGLVEISTGKAPEAVGPYSQGIMCGDLLFVSGQIGLVPGEKRLVGPGIEEQTRQVMDNLMSIIDEAGCEVGDLVKLTIYLKDLADFPVVNGIYGEYFERPYPARATVEVSGIPLGGLVEMDAVAVRRRR